MDNLGRRLKKIREKTRFTQEEIAGMLGVRRLVITNIEMEQEKLQQRNYISFQRYMDYLWKNYIQEKIKKKELQSFQEHLMNYLINHKKKC